MKTRILLSLAIALTATAARSQLMPAGTSLMLGTVTFTRGGAGFNAGELMQRFDAEQLRGFGIESASPNHQVVHGITTMLRQFGGGAGVANTVGLYVYGENPAQPGFPDLATPLAFVDNVPVQSAPMPTVATFAQPALVPIGSDVFVGIRLGPGIAPVSGTFVAVLFGSVSSSSFELAGGAMPASPPQANSHRLFRGLTTNAVTYQSRAVYHVDLLVATPGGAPTTIYQAGALPGTTTPLAGLHPDATSPSTNPGRADHVGFLFADNAQPDGTPIAFIASFADFAPIVALDGVVPGSVGGICLDPATVFPTAVGITAGGRAWTQNLISPATRLVIGGAFWTQQAIALDLATGTLRATQCGKQRF
jgi:hypothetical protein